MAGEKGGREGRRGNGRGLRRTMGRAARITRASVRRVPRQVRRRRGPTHRRVRVARAHLLPDSCNALVREEIKHLKFLFDTYRPAWWWEVWECAQKLLLTGLLNVLFPRARGVNRAIFATIVALANLALLTHTKPFIEQSDDALAVSAGWSRFFVLFAGLLLRLRREEVDEAEEARFTVLLHCCVAVVPLLALTEWAREMRCVRSMRKRLKLCARSPDARSSSRVGAAPVLRSSNAEASPSRATICEPARDAHGPG